MQTRWGLVRLSLWSMRHRDSLSASCLRESASGRLSHHCICKRRTTSRLIRPCYFGNIRPQYFQDVSAPKPGFAQFFSGENWCTGFSRHLTKSRDDARGDRPRFPTADRASIGLYNRDDLRGGACEEAFVSNKNIVARDVSFQNLDAEFGGD